MDELKDLIKPAARTLEPAEMEIRLGYNTTNQHWKEGKGARDGLKSSGQEEPCRPFLRGCVG
jgi:hypothetical protein